MASVELVLENLVEKVLSEGEKRESQKRKNEKAERKQIDLLELNPCRLGILNKRKISRKLKYKMYEGDLRERKVTSEIEEKSEEKRRIVKVRRRVRSVEKEKEILSESESKGKEKRIEKCAEKSEIKKVRMVRKIQKNARVFEKEETSIKEKNITSVMRKKNAIEEMMKDIKTRSIEKKRKQKPTRKKIVLKPGETSSLGLAMEKWITRENETGEIKKCVVRKKSEGEKVGRPESSQ